MGTLNLARNGVGYRQVFLPPIFGASFMRILRRLFIASIFGLLCASEAFAQTTTIQDRAITAPNTADPNPVTPAIINTELTAIDRYVAAPDPSYKWDLVNTLPVAGGTLFVIDLKSQTWLRPDEVDRPLWQHWLSIYKPEGVVSNKAMLFIAGGGNGGEAPKKIDPMLIAIATATKSVVVELKQIPNQPLIFHGDGKPRVEDDLIGYTWDQFIKTGDERWPARGPMTKSVVRAMDTVESFMSSDNAGKMQINQFVVAGGSKRGWTTWMSAAVDKRVIAIAPLVIDVLNLDVSMRHHYGAYGFWAPAIDEYVDHRIMQRRDDPRYKALMQIEDPFAYRDRFTIPKCIVNATGDQFFLPDSSQFYYDQLPGEKHLCYFPNTDHSLKDSKAIETLTAFHHTIVNGTPRPEFVWTLGERNKLQVQCKTQPKRFVLWQANNPEARDFRVDTIGKAYKPTELKEVADGIFESQLVAPEKGWQASFIQCEFDVGAPVPIYLSTSVKVLPDTLPFLSKQIPKN
jgi:PhoPQ-activated pathogenicity-related protein